MTSAPAIGFEYRPSRWLGRLLGVVSALAILSVWLSGVPGAVKLLLVVVLVAAAYFTIMRSAKSLVTAAGCGRDGSWSLRMVGSEDVPATLQSFRVVGATVVWLRLKAPGHRGISLLLTPDNSDADIRRRLRTRLALAASAGLHTAGTLPEKRGPTV
jgi:toxin CptA